MEAPAKSLCWENRTILQGYVSRTGDLYPHPPLLGKRRLKQMNRRHKQYMIQILRRELRITTGISARYLVRRYQLEAPLSPHLDSQTLKHHLETRSSIILTRTTVNGGCRGKVLKMAPYSNDCKTCTERPASCAGNYMSLNYKSSCRVICKIQQGERESAVIMVNEKCSLIDGTYFIVYFFFVFKFVFHFLLLALPCWNSLFIRTLFSVPITWHSL